MSSRLVTRGSRKWNKATRQYEDRTMNTHISNITPFPAAPGIEMEAHPPVTHQPFRFAGAVFGHGMNLPAIIQPMEMAFPLRQ